MTNFLKAIGLMALIFNLVLAEQTVRRKKFSNSMASKRNQRTAHISPELINELKDFENLIPAATVDEIVAKHYLIDGNFRTALKYLRSQEFTELQRQLLFVPEIVDVLKFLHLTVENATTMQMGATKKPANGKRVVASLDPSNEAASTANSYESKAELTTTKNGGIVTEPQTLLLGSQQEWGAANHLKSPERPQQQHFYIKEESNRNFGLNEHDIDDEEAVYVNSNAFSEQQTLVHIVLLEDSEVSSKGQQQQHTRQHHHHHLDKYKYHRYSSLGTFTSFVDEVLEHLPNAAYQQMISDKCQHNPNFEKFYQALRSPIFKPYIEYLKLKPNIQNIIKTLNSHDVDVNALETIAFEVISWGPNI